jgi:hypothetical protein
MGSPSCREDCDDGGGAEDKELMGVIMVPNNLM